ncbi:hypothetical protein E1176_05195 [Fulvivirga sp. RKSG066]|uniref:hypothetical protein n=1 Tax=Fulvivirga aurantia TaxID=2529383 RepID=UPI0012BCB539|nr:hypothetical protein [Fulvivirga aurantia]MTI20411.1 hypothetical protein [Fulvivirga aurantia]
MFGLFKRKDKKPALPALTDLNNQPLKEGDLVEALRYNLGQCKLVVEENSYFYQSLENGQKTSWLKMIDASTDTQKVKKIDH